MLNKINQSVYTTLTDFQALSDGSIQVRYVIGVGADKDGEITDFDPIVDKVLYIPQEQANELNNLPLTAEDVGKRPQEILLARCYAYLKETGEIKV